MVYKINRKIKRPSVPLALKIIRAMAVRGQDITLSELRPDLAELLNSGAGPDAAGRGHVG